MPETYMQAIGTRHTYFGAERTIQYIVGYEANRISKIVRGGSVNCQGSQAFIKIPEGGIEIVVHRDERHKETKTGKLRVQIDAYAYFGQNLDQVPKSLVEALRTAKYNVNQTKPVIPVGALAKL